MAIEGNRGPGELLDNVLNRLHAIPEELRALPQWVCWKLVDKGKKNKDGSGRLEKLPYCAISGELASSTDKDTWSTYKQACEVANRYDGIGFVFTASDPYTGVDLDKDAIGEDGKPSPWAQAIIERLDSYTEVSVSGKGFHIIVNAAKHSKTCRKGHVEVYDSGRFFCVTGNHLPGTPAAIENRQAELDTLLAEVFSPEAQKSKGNPAPAPPCEWDVSDSDLLIRAMAAKNGAKFSHLWQGDASGYDSQSEAEAALCLMLSFWTGKDAPRIDRLFRQSGLYREKWEREDYRTATIERAIALTTDIYKPSDHTQRIAEHSARKAEPEEARLTDLGNAERLIAAHGADLRYNEDSGKWLIWNGRCWQPDNTGEVDRLARLIVRAMYDDLSDLDRGAAERLFRHIQKSESRPRLEAMIALARHCPGIPVLSRDLDSDHWLLNCVNGTLDLRTGRLRPHSQADLMTKSVPIEYRPEAECPRWMLFLEEVFSGDTDLIAFVKRMVGYMLTGDIREESLFVLTGKGQNGKSKFVETLRAMLGDYAQDTPITALTERKDATSFDLPALAGARLVTAAEGEGSQTFNESLLKRLTGGDPITCCFKFKDYFTYVPTFKVLFSTNEIPRIRSQNFAMKRRIKLIPFRQRFYDREDGLSPVKDDQLIGKLLAELPGILRWAVEGCSEWLNGGLQTPAVVKREVEKLFEEQDPLAEFIESECILEPGAEVGVGHLWEAYGHWCKANDRCDAKDRPLTLKQPQALSRNFVQRDGIDSRRGTGGTRLLTGIRLLGDPDKVLPGVLSDVSDEKSPFSEPYPNDPFMKEGSQNTESSSLSSLAESEEEEGEGF